MLLPDVNVMVAAHRPESVHHAAALEWLTRALEADEPLGYSDHVLAATVRITTNRRIFEVPSSTTEALTFCDDVRNASGSLVVAPGPRHWSLFSGLCREVGAKGNLVPDAYLAALAVEHGATWVTYDRGFARFPGLRWTTPPP